MRISKLAACSGLRGASVPLPGRAGRGIAKDRGLCPLSPKLHNWSRGRGGGISAKPNDAGGSVCRIEQTVVA